MVIDGTQAINLIKRAPAVLRKLLMPSITATVARIFAHETGRQHAGLNHVLRTKISVIPSDDDADFQKGFRIYSVKTKNDSHKLDPSNKNDSHTRKLYADFKEELKDNLRIELKTCILIMI